MRRGMGVIAFVGLAAMANPALARPICTTLADLDVPNEDIDQGFALPDTSAHAAGCVVSLNLDGGRSLHCIWRFDYRAADAKKAFEILVAKVAACGDAAEQLDQGVNHPDSYDLRQFTLQDRGFAVSLKDKGALQQTLVFLTVKD